MNQTQSLYGIHNYTTPSGMFRLANALPTIRGVSSSRPGNYADPSGIDEAPISNTAASANPRPTTPIQNIPPWVTEVDNSQTTRHSRASSIISTQSKFSVNTLHEDARSIDIAVAGQYFRISRDGSRITADAPPPYTGPGEMVRFRGSQASDIATMESRTESDAGNDSGGETEDGATTPRSTLAILDRDQGVRANILDPMEFEMPSPVGHDRLPEPSSSATPARPLARNSFEAATGTRSSFEEGTDILSTPVMPHPGRRAASQGQLSTLEASKSQASPLRRTTGVRLPRLITSSDVPNAPYRPQRFRKASAASPGRPLQVRSAGAILGDVLANREPRSPDYIGRNAGATFPIPNRAATTHIDTGFRNSHSLAGEATTPAEGEANEESNTPLAMDDENDISLHYARMMRRLDAGHRKALHFKDKQVSELREKLNEKDIVLRQQLRAKDFIIDDLKKRLDNLEETVETMLEKARHEVEDLWESRWKDRDFHLRERMRRIEEDAQGMIKGLRTGQAQSVQGSGSPL